jgi:hypothetical protein
MRNGIAGVLLAVGIGALLLAGYLFWRETPPPEVPAGEPALPVPAGQAPPPVRHPLGRLPAEALPEIDHSDELLARAGSELLGAAPWRALVVADGLVRRIVATVDNLPRRDAPVKTWPLRPAAGWIETGESAEGIFVAPGNARRYAAYVRLVDSLDAQRLVALYRRFYPLFQLAYQELGFPDRYFNDRLVEAIDDLLATPEPAAPLHLVADKVRFRFADADLDGRSAGQKILLRIGIAHARVVKAKLRELRAALLAAPAG